jgi:hypothetical protein
VFHKWFSGQAKQAYWQQFLELHPVVGRGTACSAIYVTIVMSASYQGGHITETGDASDLMQGTAAEHASIRKISLLDMHLR